MCKSLHRKRALRTALLLLLMTAGATNVFAQQSTIFTAGSFKYQITDEANHEVALYGISDSQTNPLSGVNFPSSVSYNSTVYSVTSISNNAFGNSTLLLSAIIPSSVTSIGTYAFTGCENLTYISIPNSVEEIGEGAFYGCTDLYSAKWPASAGEIPVKAFQGCTSLTSYDIPEGVWRIWNNAFEGCTGLQSVSLPSSLTSMFSEAFKDCSDINAVYSYRVDPVDITPSAFSNVLSGDDKIYVPASAVEEYKTESGWSNYASYITAMPADKFLTYSYDEGNLTATVTGSRSGIAGDLVIPNGVYYQGSTYAVNAMEPNVFMNCNTLTSVTIPDAVTSIAEKTFSSCTGLASVNLPANLTTIGNMAFKNCSALTSIEIPNGVNLIGNNAFYATGLTTLTLPASVSSIDYNAFRDCGALETVYALRATPPTLGSDVFTGIHASPTLYVPYGSASNYSEWNSTFGFTINELPADIQYSYDEVNHTATVTGYAGDLSGALEIPATVTYNSEDYTVTAIGDEAFKNFFNLTSIVLPNTVTSIGTRAFMNCRQAAINIPEGLAMLGEGAFTDCDALTEMTLPATLTSVPALGFYSCSNLATMTLPATMTSLGIRAFYGCSNLTNIISLASTPPACSEGTFANVPSSCWVDVPMGCYDAYENAYGWSALSIRSGGFTYTLDEVNHTSTITGCSDHTFGDIVIPTAINATYTVTAIADNAFSDKSNICSISIPATVTSIGSSAFSNCKDLAAFSVDDNNADYKTVDGVLLSNDGKQLVAYPNGKTDTYYEMPNSVETIKNYAFEGSNNLTSVKLSASLISTTSFPSAFYGTDNLATLTVDAGNTYFTAINGVLFTNPATNLIYYPRGKAGQYTVPSTVTYILAQAFADCPKLTGITLNDGLESIEQYAFARSTGLTSISIPEGITNIYMCTFMNCTNLKTVSLPTSLNNIAQFAFANTGLVSLTLPENIEDIGNNAFSGCVNLGEVTLNSLYLFVPSGQYIFNGIDTSEIPLYVNAAQLNNFASNAPWSYFDVQPWPTPNGYLEYAWSDVNNTAVVTGVSDSQAISGDLVIPGTLTRNNKTYTVIGIADEAFDECINLTSVTIPHTIESIGLGAFHACTGLQSVSIGRNVTSIGSYAFESCYALTTIDYYPVNCQTIGMEIWKSCGTDAKTLNIKNCVQTIPNDAFHYLNGLSSVTIPSSVTAIGESAFAYCDMTSITIGSNVKTIGNGAFYESGLTSVDLQNVETLDNAAFYGCANLASVTLRNSQQTISESCFEDCTSLNNVSIPSGTRTIGKKAFKGCTNLANIDFGGYASNLETIGEEAFGNCTALKGETNPYASGKKYINLPESVTTIGTKAFSGCTGMEGLWIGKGVTTIGKSAFEGCTGLENIYYYAANCNKVPYGIWLYAEGSGTKTLTIGNTVETIPAYAFNNLKEVTTAKIPNSVHTIGENAFSFTDLTSIDMTEATALTTIGDLAFQETPLYEVIIPNSVTTIGYLPFRNCANLSTISLGSSVSYIGSQLFDGCNDLTSIYSYNSTPPTLNQYALDLDAMDNAEDITVYVPAWSLTAYRNAPYWKDFFDAGAHLEALDGLCRFVGAGGTAWTNPDNWEAGLVPDEYTTAIIIDGNATVDEDVTIELSTSLAIESGRVLTVPNGKKLTINGSVTNNAASLVIQDGGNLWNSNTIQATVERNITAHTSNSGWNFIASPLKGEHFNDINGYYAQPDEIENMLSGSYDLFQFDQTQLGAEWQNYKLHGFGLYKGKGYLYANANDVILKFAGTVEANEMETQIDLVYTDQQIEVINPENPEEPATYEDYPLVGWNLVGNPFACDAYLSSMSTGFDQLNFYKMNDDGDNIVAVENISGTAIPVCEGIFVKTPDNGTTSIVFVRDPMMMSAPNNGNLNLVLQQSVERGTSTSTTIDNAIVSFNVGSMLEKFVFNAETSKLYIPQDGKNYAIVWSEGRGEVPVNFKATRNGRYSLTVAPSMVDMAYLHLIDNLTGADVNLLETPTYTFNGKTSDYASRFRLVFDNGNTSDNSDNFAYVSNGNIVITGADASATLQIVDMTGRVLVSANGLHTVSTTGMPSGVYVLRLVNGNDVKVQKIVVR